MLSLAAIGMLLYALLGEPQYVFFGNLKLVVAAASLASAIAVFTVTPWLSPLSLGLLATGWVEATGKMKRDEWIPWNWASVALLGISVLISVWPSLNREKVSDWWYDHKENIGVYVVGALMYGTCPSLILLNWLGIIDLSTKETPATPEETFAATLRGSYASITDDLVMDIDSEKLVITFTKGDKEVAQSSLKIYEDSFGCFLPNQQYETTFKRIDTDTVEFIVPTRSTDNRITFYHVYEPDYDMDAPDY